MTERVYLVDASIYIFRAYFSMPDAFFAPNGYPVNALYGYASFWITFLRKQRPVKVVAAYDESLGSCFRNSIYPDYKMSRVLPDPELAFQLEACKGFTEVLGIPSPASDTYEADDIIATLAAAARRRGEAVTVVSRDKDLGQLLLADNDRFWDFSADQQLDEHLFFERFGVRPSQFADFLALVGDKIDDIPGVPGLGPKSAAALLQRYRDIDAIYADLPGVAGLSLRGAAKLSLKLQEYRDQVLLSRQLTGLHSRVPLSARVKKMQWRPPALIDVYEYLQAFGLGDRMLRQLQRAEWWQ